MKIGWIADELLGKFGGAEFSSSELVRGAPPWADLVECSPENVPSGLDAYVLLNNATYGPEIIPALETGIVVKSVRDQWPDGDDELRDWLLNNAAVTIFNSLPHYMWFMYPVGTPVAILPPPMNLQRFRDAAEVAGERSGVLWLGAMHRNKGIMESIFWARDNETEVHFYGTGTCVPNVEKYVVLKGPVPYEDVPAVMTKYSRFLYTPRVLDGFARTVAEAWAAGLYLETSGIIGAEWWIENHPDSLDYGMEMFWSVVAASVGQANGFSDLVIAR